MEIVILPSCVTANHFDRPSKTSPRNYRYLASPPKEGKERSYALPPANGDGDLITISCSRTRPLRTYVSEIDIPRISTICVVGSFTMVSPRSSHPTVDAIPCSSTAAPSPPIVNTSEERKKSRQTTDSSVILPFTTRALSYYCLMANDNSALPTMCGTVSAAAADTIVEREKGEKGTVGTEGRGYSRRRISLEDVRDWTGVRWTTGGEKAGRSWMLQEAPCRFFEFARSEFTMDFVGPVVPVVPLTFASRLGIFEVTATRFPNCSAEISATISCFLPCRWKEGGKESGHSFTDFVSPPCRPLRIHWLSRIHRPPRTRSSNEIPPPPLEAFSSLVLSKIRNLASKSSSRSSCIITVSTTEDSPLLVTTKYARSHPLVLATTGMVAWHGSASIAEPSRVTKSFELEALETTIWNQCWIESPTSVYHTPQKSCMSRHRNR